MAPNIKYFLYLLCDPRMDIATIESATDTYIKALRTAGATQIDVQTSLSTNVSHQNINGQSAEYITDCGGVNQDICGEHIYMVVQITYTTV